MGAYGRIQKNIQNNIIKDVFKSMTFEEYQEGIKKAVKIATNDLSIAYQDKLNKLESQYNENLYNIQKQIIDTISVELLYELANQLGCFDENPEYLEQKIDRVQEIYSNTMKSIAGYTKYKNNKQAEKEFLKKKKKIEKIFNIIF